MNIKTIVIASILSLSSFMVFMANRFVNTKIANDTAIAQDTRRIADSLDSIATIMRIKGTFTSKIFDTSLHDKKKERKETISFKNLDRIVSPASDINYISVYCRDVEYIRNGMIYPEVCR